MCVPRRGKKPGHWGCPDVKRLCCPRHWTSVTGWAIHIWRTIRVPAHTRNPNVTDNGRTCNYGEDFLPIPRHLPSFLQRFLQNLRLAVLSGKKKKKNRIVLFFIYSKTPETFPCQMRLLLLLQIEFIILSKWIKMECHLLNVTFLDLTLYRKGPFWKRQDDLKALVGNPLEEEEI